MRKPVDDATMSREEIDDQFRGLMEGLRTTIPGVMVLFSFLLILPLQSSFTEISLSNTIVFYVAFASAAISSVVYLVSSVVFGDPLAAAQTALFSTVAGWAWFYLPLVRFKKDD